MKKFLTIFSLIAMTFSFLIGCRTSYAVSQSGGQDDQAYLIIASAGENRGHVSVCIDHGSEFNAEVVKTRDAERKGTAYVVPTGRHSVAIIKDGKIIKEQIVFLSQQETKIILIP